MRLKSDGQRAYEGYFKACNGKSLISGAPLPSWDAQSEAIRLAWEAAVDAVTSVRVINSEGVEE